MRVPFTKMHGLGNDFVVFEPGAAPEPAQLAALADRHAGIGFDQALLLGPARNHGSIASYRIVNADGSEVGQCGNGARCLAALLLRRGAAPGSALTLDSPAGPVRARLEDDGLVSVEIGVPDFDPAALPFRTDPAEPGQPHPRERLEHPLEVGGQVVGVGLVALGNPHAVLCVPAVAGAPVTVLGPAIERHARFPERVNVGFAQPLAPDAIRLRVWERGAGETQACGTGACAAVVVLRRRGLLEAQVRVHARGGELRVHWPGPGTAVWLTGPAAISFEGQVEV